MKKTQSLDWPKFIEYSMEQQNIAEFTATLDRMDGRELYEMETLCLVNKTTINKPVDYAFHRTVINYPVEPVDIMRACLIDGQVFLRVEDGDHIRVEEFVSRAEWDSFTDELIFVEIKYVYKEENGGDYYHIEHFTKDIGSGRCLWEIYHPVHGDVPEKDWKVASEIELPYFPYVGIRWVFNQSFLMPIKSAIIRLEAAYRVIGAENIERMGLSLYIEGIRDVDEIKTAPRKMGRRVHLLPKDSKFHSPNPDAPGMELMVIEIENLQIAIEKATGVVSVERLATLSGVSRAIAEKPLIILADELRSRFSAGMEEVYAITSLFGGKEPEISYRPLKYIEDKNIHLDILDRARELNKVNPNLGITEEQYSVELRLLLDLELV